MAQHPNAGKERRWLDLIRGWRRSRLSVREFCWRRRLSEPSFYAWRRRLREGGLIDADPSAESVPVSTTPAFVKLAVDAGAGPERGIDLVLAEGRLLRVRPGFDPDLLRQLLRLLEEPSC